MSRDDLRREETKAAPHPGAGGGDEDPCEVCGGTSLGGRSICRGCLYHRHIMRLDHLVDLFRASITRAPVTLTAAQQEAWDALWKAVNDGPA